MPLPALSFPIHPLSPHRNISFLLSSPDPRQPLREMDFLLPQALPPVRVNPGEEDMAGMMETLAQGWGDPSKNSPEGKLWSCSCFLGVQTSLVPGISPDLGHLQSKAMA